MDFVDVFYQSLYKIYGIVTVVYHTDRNAQLTVLLFSSYDGYWLTLDSVLVILNTVRGSFGVGE